MEYSIDTGVSYSDISEDDMTLDAGELSSIDPTKDFQIRVKETGSEEASALATIDIIAAPSVTFSFSGNDADKLMGALTTMSYSLDGGATYSDVGSDDVLLSSSAIESMSSSNDIHIKIKEVDSSEASMVQIIDLVEGPSAPAVTRDDSADTITGMTTSMEFSSNSGSSWTRYNNNLPDLTGTITIRIRLSPTNNTLAGQSVSLSFTEPAPPSGGGGGGGFVPIFIPPVIPPEADLEPGTVEVTYADVLTSISGSNDEVTVEVESVEGTQNVSIEPEVLSALAKADKAMVIDGDQLDVTIPVGAFDNYIIGNNEKLQMDMSELDNDNLSEELDDAVKDDGKGLFSVGGKVFEFSATIVSDSSSKAITSFDVPLTITIKLSKDELKNVDESKLGVYYYNESTGDWEYVGGAFNAATGEIQFDTSHFSYYAIMVFEKTFGDMSNHWARSYIETMASKHITKGKSDSVFDPDNNTTRSEFVALVVRALGLLESDEPETLPYSDVSLTKWYYSEISKAFDNNLITSSSEFYPELDISREDMTVIISAALMSTGGYEILDESEVDLILEDFEDADIISDGNRSAVALAIKHGIINGRTVSTIVPDANATRAETMVVVSRLLKIIEATLFENE